MSSIKADISPSPQSQESQIQKQAGQKRTPETRNSQVDMVAKLYEKQFLREMVRAMRQTVSFGEMTQPSMAENIFREQLDQEYVESWGEQGGIGLADVIYDSLMERFFPNSGAQSRARSLGPPQLSEAGKARLEFGDTKNMKTVNARVEMPPGVQPARAKSPWSGLLESFSSEAGQTSVLIDHGQGLKSTVQFSGVLASDLRLGQKVEGGQELGLLDPQNRSFFWNLRQNISDLSVSL